jgi:hypothetical protein
MSAVARGYLVAILAEAVVIALIGVGLILAALFVAGPKAAAKGMLPPRDWTRMPVAPNGAQPPGGDEDRS